MPKIVEKLRRFLAPCARSVRLRYTTRTLPFILDAHRRNGMSVIPANDRILAQLAELIILNFASEERGCFALNTPTACSKLVPHRVPTISQELTCENQRTSCMESFEKRVLVVSSKSTASRKTAGYTRRNSFEYSPGLPRWPDEGSVAVQPTLGRGGQAEKHARTKLMHRQSHVAMHS